ncbi:hypothetical protein TWF569_007273 [Orbilia oligospora]|uniref:DJ-1/PfpI domain-containing protein n=1 Tax=Orbilia oligospora TaxID=2813651 RepID=A0A7C8N8Y1_ORBOL|nr:hypothetical protein TWF706_010523 [Orbilia oligospora]KAF3090202.1 hypothetical protein TWF102_009416 [Orbilia oligospora]KAF3094362.1 hypothetical protein TWF103_010559 [Orbilia oligospora]KAF3141804.1 hypothetical protein TWF594_005862 [Orbilia oligospora]KAF3143656.1 hypothetical protein TWF569_007273 [Orbilia oligospora]
MQMRICAYDPLSTEWQIWIPTQGSGSEDIKIASVITTFCAGLSAATNVQPQPGPKPQNIGIALFKGWQPLDVFGPIEAFWGLGTSQPINIYLLSEDGVSSEIKPYTPFATNSNTSATVLTGYSYANPPPLDVLLVPGGVGTRNDAGVAPVITFVKEVYPSLQYIISVCTGASILARAGLLDGKRATTNKRAWAFVTQFGQRVRWNPKARYIRDRNVWTTSGVSAGVDGVLGWIEYVWGSAVATGVENGMEWNRVGANDDKFGKLYGLW